MRTVCLLASLVLAAAAAEAKVVTEEVRYTHDQLECVGYLAYDDTRAERRPGVVVVHEWWGLNDYARRRARQLAEMGYVALAIDLYGGGKTTTDREEAARLAGALYQNTDAWRERAKAGFEALARNSCVDPARIVAIGYCFGGASVLQMAYSGLPLAGVVSFHGSLAPPREEDAPRIKARILVLHGADDPFVSAADVAAFQEGVRKAAVDWQMEYYGGAVHSFTNPAVDAAGIDGAKYNRNADERSWRRMQLFFSELFGESVGRGARSDE
jgi:dienelactone hydrolase